MQDEIAPQTRRYFFIVGSPRSGTTLLQAMLSQAPGVTIPNETKFIPRILKREATLGPITSQAGWEAAINAVKTRCRQGEFKVDTKRLEQQLLAIPDDQRTHGNLLRGWLDLCGSEEDSSVVGEKTPEHTRHISTLAHLLPEARFVHIIRDPRDVALSQLTSFDGRSIRHAALRWRKDMQAWHESVSDPALSSVCMAIHYEDLVSEPETTIRKVADFLDLQIVSSMFDPSGRAETGFSKAETHKALTLERPTKNRIGRYRGRLEPAQIGEIQAICRSLMVAQGYKLEPYTHMAALARVGLRLPFDLMARQKRLAEQSTRIAATEALSDE